MQNHNTAHKNAGQKAGVMKNYLLKSKSQCFKNARAIKTAPT